MTGPEHYREAERLIAVGESVVAEIRAAKGDEQRRDALGKQAMGIWAQAQVHATLAHVAAEIDSCPPTNRRIAWQQAVGGNEREGDDG